MDVIKAKPTPYQQYLIEKGYCKITTELISRGKSRREYLAYDKRCLFCNNNGRWGGYLEPFKMINGRNTAKLVCNHCNKILGIWYDMSESGDVSRWEYTPSEDTVIFRERFDIARKIKNTLLGLPL